MSKDGFFLYNNQKSCFDLLSMEQRGLLVTALFEYVETGTHTQPLSDAANMAFMFVSRQIEYDDERYQAIVERNRKNGVNGGRPKKRTVFEETQENPEKPRNPVGYLGYFENPTKPKKTQENPKNRAVFEEGKEAKEEKEEVTKKNKEQSEEKEEYTPLIFPPSPLVEGGNITPKNEERTLTKVEERFIRFWDAYPRKVGKAYAYKCFVKINPSEKLLQQMLQAITEQKQSKEWIKDGGEFIPHPSTWLNQGRWDDEVTVDTLGTSTPKYSNSSADDAMTAALKRTYGG